MRLFYPRKDKMQMVKYIEKAQSMTLPTIALRGIVAFPSVPISIELIRDKSIAACKAAQKGDGMIFLCTQEDISVEDPKEKDLYRIGCVAKIRQSIKTKGGGVRIIVAGTARAKLVSCTQTEPYIVSDIITKDVDIDGDLGLKGEALVMEARDTFDSFSELLPSVSDEIKATVHGLSDPALLADFIASNVLIKYEDKQEVLEKTDPMARLELTCVLMERESSLLAFELDIHKRVRAKLDKNQRDYYLREQMRLIQSELGEESDMSDSEEYLVKIENAKLPEEVTKKLRKEALKLDKMQFGSAESSVIRNYLDVCLELPWTKATVDRTDVAAAKRILERDHDGLEKVKERILEYIAVKTLNPDAKNQILCLVGPPGVGKTSIASSVAASLKRKFVRVSLGGVRDEADIRGHRKTYVGSMPGRIIEAIGRAGVKNPLILLDEIDKLTKDSHGDPASALLEVLDAEQNKNFRDHFLEMPFDLSDCIFFATANTLDTVPAPLIDRMEIIKLSSYTRQEKLSIAKHHLLPKQLKRHGLSKKTLSVSDSALMAIIDGYTSEAGVRNLERQIGAVCRKAASRIIDGAEKIKVTDKNLADMLGAVKIIPDKIADEDEIAVVNGLAYTEVGGEMLRIEVAVFDGTGKIELTGSLGDVMKESAKTAVSCVRGMAGALGIDGDFYKNKDIHIHAPEGAVPKDGPSAGITMTTALVSALCGRAVRRDVAMTGEITLRANVLPIGGLKEKSMAAYKAGVKTVIIPAANEKDLCDIDPAVRESIEFIPVKNAYQVLELALVSQADTQNKSTDTLLIGANLPNLVSKTNTVRTSSLETSK